MTAATSPQRPPATRLAIVVSHPTQYYSPWFRWLAVQVGLPLRVFYLWDFGVTERRDPQFQKTFRWDVDLLSGYEHEMVPNVAREPNTQRFGGLRNPGLTKRLAAWKPEAVLLFGYKSRSHLSVIGWARRRGVPLLFRGDSHFLGRGPPGFLPRAILRKLYAQFAAVLPVGAANRDYFAALGVGPERQFFTPHSVDHRLFDPTRADHRSAAATLRARLGLTPATRVVLFAGKWQTSKQPVELARAFLALRMTDTALVMVGDGPEKDTLTEVARGARNVHFLPFANQTEMPARMLLADIFALPSLSHYETWGLAVNEAMHMGVPALVSDLVGCQRDLVTDGETGWVVPAGQPAALQIKLGQALSTMTMESSRQKLREAVARRIAGYTYVQAARGLLAALAAVRPAPG